MMQAIPYIRDKAVHALADFEVFEQLAAKNRANRLRANGKGLQIIGAGFSRTATLAMYSALIELGYHVYHGVELPSSPSLIELGYRWYDGSEIGPSNNRNVDKWQSVIDADLKNGNTDGIDWHEVVKGYDAGFDMPFADYWLELSRAFPDAKVIYTYRDGGSWMQSVKTALLDPMTHDFWFRIAVFWAPPAARVLKVVQTVQRKYMRDYGGPYATGGLRTELIQERLEAIQREIPPEKLLVFHPKMGWEPLCAFLGKPVPDIPFPRINDGPSLAWVLRSITIVGMGLWITVLVMLVLLFSLARWSCIVWLL